MVWSAWHNTTHRTAVAAAAAGEVLHFVLLNERCAVWVQSSVLQFWHCVWSSLKCLRLRKWFDQSAFTWLLIISLPGAYWILQGLIGSYWVLLCPTGSLRAVAPTFTQSGTGVGSGQQVSADLSPCMCSDKLAIYDLGPLIELWFIYYGRIAW